MYDVKILHLLDKIMESVDIFKREQKMFKL